MLIKNHQTPENRKHERHKLIYYLDSFDRDTHQFIGHLVDLSLEGAMLTSKISIPPNTKLNLLIALTLEPNNVKYFEIQAITTRCQRDVNIDYYNIGLHLINLNAQIQETIQYLIDAYKF